MPPLAKAPLSFNSSIKVAISVTVEHMFTGHLQAYAFDADGVERCRTEISTYIPYGRSCQFQTPLILEVENIGDTRLFRLVVRKISDRISDQDRLNPSYIAVDDNENDTHHVVGYASFYIQDIIGADAKTSNSGPRFALSKESLIRCPKCDLRRQTHSLPEELSKYTSGVGSLSTQMGTVNCSQCYFAIPFHAYTKLTGRLVHSLSEVIMKLRVSNVPSHTSAYVYQVFNQHNQQIGPIVPKCKQQAGIVSFDPEQYLLNDLLASSDSGVDSYNANITIRLMECHFLSKSTSVIGSVTCTIRDLLLGTYTHSGIQLSPNVATVGTSVDKNHGLFHRNKASSQATVTPVIHVDLFQLIPSLPDALSSRAYRLSVLIAIDGTQSNDMHSPSLHYMPWSTRAQVDLALQIDRSIIDTVRDIGNGYLAALLQAFAGLLQFTDGGNIPMEIFGCSHGNVNLQLDPQRQCRSQEDVLYAYFDRMHGTGSTYDYTYRYSKIQRPNITLSGPTCFLPTIQKFYEDVQRDMFSSGPPTFHVLVLMTDGANIEEEQMQVKQILDAMSTMPASVIFVGVGNSNFEHLHELEDVSNEERRRHRRFGTRHVCDFFKIYEDYSTRRLVRPARFMREVGRHFHEYLVLTAQSILPDGIRNWNQNQSFSASPISEKHERGLPPPY